MNAPMTLDELAALVRAMRAAQREYFKTRSYTALATSKRLEQQVDAMLQQLGNPQRSLL